MIEFGKTLKEAREAKGLTIADIAAKTHMMSSIVEGLENEDFTRLAAPIYGRGFVKLYCETVGIEAAPMIAEFMEIFNGNREPAIRERAVRATPPEDPQEDGRGAAQEADAPAGASEPPNRTQLDLFKSEPRRAEPAPASAEHAPRPAEPAASAPHLQPPPRPGAAPIQEPAPVQSDHVLSRYATPLREHAAAIPRMAPAFGRWCVVIVVLGLLAWGIIAGVRALYRATSGSAFPTEGPVRTTEAAAPAAQADVTPKRTARTPIDVPPLYID